MSAKATSTKGPAKTAALKPAKAKAAKLPPAKQVAAPKSVKAPAKGKVKPVKAPARGKQKPVALQEEVAAQEPVVAAEPELEVYYVTLDPLPPQIHSALPGSGVQAVEFASFAEARERAIDQLIELIEEAERRLHLLRRAGSREEYPH
jgi:hypothetical protein